VFLKLYEYRLPRYHLLGLLLQLKIYSGITLTEITGDNTLSRQMDISPLIASRACLSPGFLIRRIQLKKIFPSVIHCDCNYGVGRTSLWINEGLEKRVGSYGVSGAGRRFLVYNARKLPRVHVFAVILPTRPVKILPVTPYCRKTFHVRMKSSSRRRRRRRRCRRLRRLRRHLPRDRLLSVTNSGNSS